MGNSESRELNEAARELSHAAREISVAARTWEELIERVLGTNLKDIDLGELRRERAELSGLLEEEAAKVANDAVHEFRREAMGAGGFSRGAITPEEAEGWVQRREERHRREGYEPS